MRDVLFSGKISNYYLMNEKVFICKNYGINGVEIYDFTIYLILGIWNIHLWFYERFSGQYTLYTYAGLTYDRYNYDVVGDKLLITYTDISVYDDSFAIVFDAKGSMEGSNHYIL